MSCLSYSGLLACVCVVVLFDVVLLVTLGG